MMTWQAGREERGAVLRAGFQRRSLDPPGVRHSSATMTILV